MIEVVKFKNSENDLELELSVAGYQFPDNPNDNWCLVNAKINHRGEYFEVIDPALETMEVLSILEWFKKLSLYNLPHFGHLTFTEPCIEFEFIACQEESVKISLCLSHEMKPNFKLKQFGVSFDSWNMIFDLKQKDFSSIISSLESFLQKYPIRGKLTRA